MTEWFQATAVRLCFAGALACPACVRTQPRPQPPLSQSTKSSEAATSVNPPTDDARPHADVGDRTPVQAVSPTRESARSGSERPGTRRGTTRPRGKATCWTDDILCGFGGAAEEHARERQRKEQDKAELNDLDEPDL
jgi:hypothetical protein